jgi:hypothetical protein
MRALVLGLALILSAGSATNAKQRHALSSYSCGTKPQAQQAACYANANTSYVVDSQQEMIDAQNARDDFQRAEAANQQIAARCERVAGLLMRCQFITPSAFTHNRDSCAMALGGRWQAGYPVTVCVEQAGDCAQVDWCLSQQQAPVPVQTAH